MSNSTKAPTRQISEAALRKVLARDCLIVAKRQRLLDGKFGRHSGRCGYKAVQSDADKLSENVFIGSYRVLL